MTLKPRHVLFVVAPTLLFEFACCQVLLISALLIVKNEKERIRSKLFENGRMIKHGRRRRRIRGWRWVRIARRVLTLTFRVGRSRHGGKRLVQHREVG